MAAPRMDPVPVADSLLQAGDEFLHVSEHYWAGGRKGTPEYVSGLERVVIHCRVTEVTEWQVKYAYLHCVSIDNPPPQNAHSYPPGLTGGMASWAVGDLIRDRKVEVLPLSKYRPGPIPDPPPPAPRPKRAPRGASGKHPGRRRGGVR